MCAQIEDLDLNRLILFVWSLSSYSSIFHSFGYVTIAGKGLQISQCSELVAFEQWGFFNVQHCDTGLYTAMCA